MRKMRNFKTLTAATLAASMVMGSAMTTMAAPQSGDVAFNGTGSYEGGEMKYPTLSVTLPTLSGTSPYDYIADPNGLIKLTANESGDAAAHSGQFLDAKGIYFLTETDESGKNIYSERSAAKIVKNENAQNINVTVKLEQTTAGDADLKYASSDTFDGTDKEIYLAVTDGASNTAAISPSAQAATVTTTVPGKPQNYKPNYAGSKYEYEKKAADLEDWNECSFYLTGALNTAAKWADGVAFPGIKVTWSFVEGDVVTDAAPSVNNGSSTMTYSLASARDLVIPYNLGVGDSAATEVTDVIFNWGGALFSVSGTTWGSEDRSQYISIGTNSITIKYAGFMEYCTAGDTYPVCVVIDDDVDGFTQINVTCN